MKMNGISYKRKKKLTGKFLWGKCIKEAGLVLFKRNDL